MKCLSNAVFPKPVALNIEYPKERKRKRRREGRAEGERKRGRERERQNARERERAISWPLSKATEFVVGEES